jgi:hypothetical protein
MLDDVRVLVAADEYPVATGRQVARRVNTLERLQLPRWRRAGGSRPHREPPQHPLVWEQRATPKLKRGMPRIPGHAGRVPSQMTSDADAMNDRRRRMPAPTTRPWHPIRSATIPLLATSTKPIRRSTPRIVTASGIAGESGRGARALKIRQDRVI